MWLYLIDFHGNTNRIKNYLVKYCFVYIQPLRTFFQGFFSGERVSYILISRYSPTFSWIHCLTQCQQDVNSN